MARRTYRDIFLDELEELSDGGKKWVGNISLREALGWETDRYNSIKRQLLNEDIIVVARGKVEVLAWPMLTKLVLQTCSFLTLTKMPVSNVSWLSILSRSDAKR